jgi:hypothetical protein
LGELVATVVDNFRGASAGGALFAVVIAGPPNTPGAAGRCTVVVVAVGAAGRCMAATVVLGAAGCCTVAVVVLGTAGRCTVVVVVLGTAGRCAVVDAALGVAGCCTNVGVAVGAACRCTVVVVLGVAGRCAVGVVAPGATVCCTVVAFGLAAACATAGAPAGVAGCLAATAFGSDSIVKWGSTSFGSPASTSLRSRLIGTNDLPSRVTLATCNWLMTAVHPTI